MSRVLVACEYSGVVRDAFLALGHDAVSCDLLPTESPGPHHRGDVRDILKDGWDLMVAHPTCTYLCNSGVRWLWQYDWIIKATVTDATGQKIPDWRRWRDMEAGAIFFRQLLDAPIPRIAIENPTMHGHANRIVNQRHTQIVQPWMFGHPETKATGLWLKGLPPLVATEDVRDVMTTLPKRESSRVHYASPGPDRWKLRSTTLTGVASAMAYQWAGDIREAVA